MADVVLRDESYAVMGACFEVYNQLGCGFLEAVYHECLELELADRRIPFVSKPKLPIEYKGRIVGCFYEADLICFDQIILEIKAVSELSPIHEAQVMHYLRATRLPLGILLNFGHFPDLHYKRIASTRVKHGALDFP
jgi:GxxExxY protein